MFLDKLFGHKDVILGVDIGTSNVKIAQISFAGKPVLETYGLVNCKYQLTGKNDAANIEQMAGILKSLIAKAGATAKRCVISFPNSAVFSSVINLPQMTDKELAKAVEFEAKKYVPLALSDIDLSFSVISKEPSGPNPLKILLTAVPKQTTSNYTQVLSMAGLQPLAGEIEALALIRSLIGQQEGSCIIIDIGARATGINIIENGFLKLSRNLNIGGDTITDKIAETLNISATRAEQFKKDFGVSSATFIPETIKPVLNLIKSEVRQLIALFKNQNTALTKILLVGGGANLPGIAQFFKDLGIAVELGNPLASVTYSPELEAILKRFDLSLAVAIGLALRKET